MQFVDDDEPQVLEQLCPLRVVRQDPRMEHVGVAQHDVCARPNGAPRVLRRVAVVGEDADVGASGLVHVRRQLMELGQLVLCKGLGGEQVDGAGRRVGQDRAENRRVVAKRLARGGRRGDDDVVAAKGVRQCGSLVRVELRDAAGFERRAQTLRRPARARARNGPRRPEGCAPVVTQPSGLSAGAIDRPAPNRSRAEVRACSRAGPVGLRMMARESPGRQLRRHEKGMVTRRGGEGRAASDE
jgi:hypothetical protein